MSLKIVFTNITSLIILILFPYVTYLLYGNLTFSRNYLILFLLFVWSVNYYLYSIHSAIWEIILTYKSRKDRIRVERETIDFFLKKKLEHKDKESLRNLIARMDHREFLKASIKGRERAITEQIVKGKRLLEEMQYKEKITQLSQEKHLLEKDIDKLKDKKEREQFNEEEKEKYIRNQLKIEENNVYRLKNLTKTQITILKKEDYKQVNEYDICENKIVTFLVKPIMNHSSTHTFLVWSTIKYLEKIKEIENIIEHETRDADITFKYEGKYYAIEIETGNLLKKQKQLKEKVEYLDNKYKNRWMFIVSNKDLVSKYRKHKLSTHRKGVQETIHKMLENQHPPKTGGKPN